MMRGVENFCSPTTRREERIEFSLPGIVVPSVGDFDGFVKNYINRNRKSSGRPKDLLRRRRMRVNVQWVAMVSSQLITRANITATVSTTITHMVVTAIFFWV